MKFWTFLFTLIACHAIYADTIVYSNKDTFLAALNNPPIVEDFDSTTGSLLPLVDVGTSFEVTDGKLAFDVNTDFHLTNFIHDTTSFTAFGAEFSDVCPGVFAVFADALFLFSRLDPNEPEFFVGFISDEPFDLVSFTHNTGSYSLESVTYTLIPSPTSIALLSIGIILILPPIKGGTWR